MRVLRRDGGEEGGQGARDLRRGGEEGSQGGRDLPKYKNKEYFENVNQAIKDDKCFPPDCAAPVLVKCEGKSIITKLGGKK